MSYIDFDYKKNSILICKGDSRNRDKIELKNTFNEYSEFTFGNEFNGIEINNFLSRLEQDGLNGELKFKELLEENNIPYLYIGQGPFGIERSGILIDKAKSKRADFLVNIKDMGTILFDAKCRKKIGFHTSDEKYYSLFVSELEALNNLQNSILMPVWLAFIDKTTINSEKKPIFHFVSISTIMKFWGGIFDYFKNEQEFREITVLRIPNELLTKIESKIIFEVGYQNVDEELLKEFAKKNIGLNRIIKDKIKELIRNKECHKSKIAYELYSQSINYCYPNEISFHVDKLIKEDIIDYQPKQFLKLVGE